MKNQTKFELYTDDNKPEYSSNPKDILKSAKISNEHFNLCEAEISLDEIIESINSEANNKPPGIDNLAASNELASVLLDFYDSWGQLDTMGVTYRTGIISTIYKR